MAAPRAQRTIDLNADVGEAVDEAGVAVERALLGLVTSVNVACGGHAGDEETMGATVAAALRHSVRVGAHPSYPDRPGFGRNPMEIDREELAASLTEQLRALGDVCRAAGTTVESVKAHGALYEEVAKGGAIYQTARDAMRQSCGPDTVLVLPSGCRAMAMVLRDGVPAREEGYCDRAYRSDGGLVDRAGPGALLSDPAVAADQALSLARGAVVASDGSLLTLWVDTLCVHGDSPGAVDIATAVRRALQASGIDVAAPRVRMTRSVPVGEVRLLGDRALLIGVTDPAAGRTLAAALADPLGGAGAGVGERAAVEIVCGFATVMVALTEPSLELDAVSAAVRDVMRRVDADGRGTDEEPGRAVTIPCAFDGPDLAEVADLARCEPADVVRMLTSTPLSVAVMGFSPGFAYLEELPEPLRAVPAAPGPRPAVPAGSVALANGHAAVYPTATPGGWQLVGRTSLPLFSTRPPYAALAPGDRVVLTAVDPGDLPVPSPPWPEAWVRPPGARRVLVVVTPGLRAVVQDCGRSGVAGIGVPGAGAADPVSFLLANRLVGNDDGAGVLETTAGGTRLRAVAPCHVAVVGGAPSLHVDATPAPAGQVLPLEAGQVLQVGPLERGCRTYVAVAGGFLAPEVFASLSSDELCGLGAGAVVAGQSLYAAPWAPPLGDHLGAGAATEVGDGATPVELRVVAGPHPECFAPDALDRLADVVFAVEDQSNRVGVRLRGVTAGAAPAASTELDSQGVVTGAVQVPPGGDPIVLGPDHATLGGYPVLAVVAAVDLGRLGQCGPGASVRLRPIGLDEAEAERQAQLRVLGRAVLGHYPVAAG